MAVSIFLRKGVGVMLYSYVLLDVREDEGEYFYTISKVFDSKYAKEIKESTFAVYVRRKDICNVKLSKKLEPFAHYYIAIAEFAYNYDSNKVLVVERDDLKSKTHRFYKFFTPDGVNLTAPLYQVIGRHTKFCLDEDAIALGVKIMETSVDSESCVADIVNLVNSEAKQTIYSEDIIKNYLFLR